VRDTLDSILIGIWLALVALTFGALGYSLASDDAPAMPECYEDEYLYPVDAEGRPQYEGPGVADPDEYGCFPFDGAPRTPAVTG
jgi:hypothetical protein